MFHFRKNCTELIGAKKELENVQLVGSWTVSVGDQDQALHLWQYNGGFEMIDTFKDVLGKSHVRFKLFNPTIHTENQLQQKSKGTYTQ